MQGLEEREEGEEGVSVCRVWARAFQQRHMIFDLLVPLPVWVDRVRVRD